MSEFHNPYHFVPVRKGDRTGDLTRETFQKGTQEYARHDRYVEKTRSGRIVCRLETKTPVFVGADRKQPDAGKAAVARPFELDGRPAIPASSLRGLVSSIAEAVSDSALRVLEKRRFSYRQPMKNALSAIGMVQRFDSADGPQYWLIPLALPLMAVSPDGKKARPADGANWEPLFKAGGNLKVYFGERDGRAIPASRIDQPSTFLLRTARWTGSDFDQYHYMRLAKPIRVMDQQGRIDVDGHCHCDRKGQWVLAQRPANDRALPISHSTYEAQSPDERAGYVRGLIRVLGVWGRDDIPSNKRHEIFIPLPNGFPQVQIPVKEEAVARFERLAKERTEEEESLPYEPRDTRAGEKRSAEEPLELRTGDLVYFRPNREMTAVEEVSFSSIWRGEVDANAHEFFTKVDSELVPFDPNRRSVTKAEQVFGFVEDKKGATKAQQEAGTLALAGRVRFSHALFDGVAIGSNVDQDQAKAYLTGDDERQLHLLKILNQPKPPSPAMYFKRKGASDEEKPIAKTELNANAHEPQGRKFYLHAREDQVRQECWKTAPARVGDDQEKMKTRVRPLRKGCVFSFHVDFDNLTDAELGMVLYALSPRDEFRHKIGMGKAIGLGSVRIDIAGVFAIQRQKRYSVEGFASARRYHEATVRMEIPAGRYPREATDAEGAEALDLEAIRGSFRADPAAAHALELIGNPAKVTQPVHPPLQVIQKDPEDQTFKWFVANDDRKNATPQSLRPIAVGKQELPTLRRN